MTKEWRAVVGYAGIYEVSDSGDIRNTKGHIKRAFPSRWDYLIIALNNGRRRNATVHSIVAAAFLGPRPDGYDINHKNGNKRDNAATNLEYVTRSENNRHAFRMGLKRGCNCPVHRGSAHGRAKLTEEQVTAIRKMHKSISNPELARTYGVSLPTIEAIVYRRLWKHLP